VGRGGCSRSRVEGGRREGKALPSPAAPIPTRVRECPPTWGSIISGHRRALLMMIAFSTLTVSVGSPAIVQARTCTGSASVAASVAPGECGTPAAASAAHHSASRAAR
jgi:hypothetical protein